MTVDVDVAVVAARLPLRVGGIAEADFEPLRRRLDHRHRERGSLGVLGVGHDRRLHAGEIPRRQQAPDEFVERSLAEEIARLDRRKGLHQFRRVAVETPHLDVAEMERRAAFDRNRQRRAFRVGVDLRFARHELGRGIGRRGEAGHRPFLRRRPRGLAKNFAYRQAPIAPQRGDGVLADGHVDLRRAQHDDLRAGDHGRFARNDGERHGDGLRAAIDRQVDLGRKESLGRRGLARLGQRFAREAVQQLFGHVREFLPADEVDGRADRAFERGRRDELYPVTYRVVGVRRGGDRRSGRGGLGVSGKRGGGRRQRQHAQAQARRQSVSRSFPHRRHYRRAPRRSLSDRPAAASRATSPWGRPADSAKSS